jgi:peptidoglycan hydrolase CwlO-like protein
MDDITQKAIFELMNERDRLKEKVSQLKEDVKKYLDACHLREDSLFAEVERREKAEEKVEKLKRAIKKYLKKVEHADGGCWECQRELKKLVEKKPVLKGKGIK